MHLYLDASALIKLIVPERSSDALAELVAGRPVLSAEIAVTELIRATNRVAREAPEAAELLRSRLDSALSAVTFLQVDRATCELAGRLDDPHLRALDAIHVACAVAVGDDVEAFVTYDRRQGHAARATGFEVLAPGLA